MRVRELPKGPKATSIGIRWSPNFGASRPAVAGISTKHRTQLSRDTLRTHSA